MKCPYCKEEIDENVNICPVCGEKIYFIFRFLDMINHHKKPITIVLLALILLYLLIFGGIKAYNSISKQMNNPTYKTIIEHETISAKDNPLYASDAINILNKQSADLMELLKSKQSKRRKNNVFSTFYENLIYYNNVVIERTGGETSIWNPRFERGKKDFISGLIIEPIMEKDYIGPAGLKIITPSADYIEFISAGEGYFVTTINYNYIYNTYSEYLDKNWKEYLEIRKKERNDLGDSSYYDDGCIMPSKQKLMEWIISWQNFQKKYPKFKSKEIDILLSRYTADFILGYENSYGITFEDYSDNAKLRPEAKTDYETFLKKVNPKTKEYKIVEKCYNALKTHDFKDNKEFSAYLEEWRNKYSDENIWDILP